MSAFDAARDPWNKHHSPYDEIVRAPGGVLALRTAGRTWIVPRGLAVWVPAGLAHETWAASSSGLRTLAVRPVRDGSFDRTGPVPLVVDPLAAELLDHLGRDGLTTRNRGLAESLLLDQVTPTAAVHLELAMPRDPRASRLAESLLAYPADPGSLEAWSRDAGISGRTLARIWVAETGTGFGAWRTRLRMQAALSRLGRGTPVNAVARHIGYETPSAFVAAFRREVGVPPGAYVG